MGTCFNPVSKGFQESLNSEIYVDKTDLIAFTNKKVNTKQKYLCVSRPRRFGKTMAAEMLAAYYCRTEDTDALFQSLNIKKDASYTKYLNQFDVIKLDMQFFLSSTESVGGMIKLLTEVLVQDLQQVYSDISFEKDTLLPFVLDSVYQKTQKAFIIIIDEWDCVMRRTHDGNEQKLYLDFLRNLLKDQNYAALVYMTGILPIKKYGEHSTLNMFDEYSMIQSHKLVPFFGFTEDEVKLLCNQYEMNFEQAKEWYDGYRFEMKQGSEMTMLSIYSPRSVVSSMLNERFDTYWAQTETYEALKDYIQMNFDGLKDAIVQMLAGNSVEVDIRSFQNDMSTFHSKDDVLTLLVHLGYLAYDQETQTVMIPNKEVAGEFLASIKNIDTYDEVFKAVSESRDLLKALWDMDSDKVACGVERAHQHFPAIQYNNENALSCVIELAFYYAREYYTIVRELPAGKGFADICFIPKPQYSQVPAVLIELKWNKSVDAALQQIKRKDYPDVLKAYHGKMLLCGINYDKENLTNEKAHQCRIEVYEK